MTISQIVQFIIDLFVVFYASWNHWAFSKWNLKQYTQGDCSGGEEAAMSGMGVLSSYLVLFIFCECIKQEFLQEGLLELTIFFSSLPKDVLAEKGKAVAECCD